MTLKITEININLKRLISICCVIIVLICLYKVLDIVFMMIFSIFVAYLLNPFVNFLERKKIPRWIGSFIIVIVILAVVLTILAFMVPMFIDNIIYLSKHTQEYAKDGFNFIHKFLARFKIDFSYNSVQTFIIERIGTISQYAVSTVTSAAASVKSVVLAALNLVLIPFLVYLLLKDFPYVRDFTLKVVSRFNLQKALGHTHEFEYLVGKYFRGMFLVAIILSVLYSVVLLIVGVKTSILLGVITGVGVLIPYVGFAFGLIISLIMTALQFHDAHHIIYLIIGFVIVQFLESFVITPKIVGESLGLNPALVIIALMVGGSLFGFFGMILALPVTAFLKILMNKYVFNKPIVK